MREEVETAPSVLSADVDGLGTRRTAAVLAAIIFIATAVRLAGLSAVPPGLNHDEAANAWNAYCLLRTGHDQVGETWPVFYSRCLGSNRSTLYLYALLPFQAIGGLGVFTTRAPNAIGGVLAVVLLYYLGRRLFGRTTGLAAAALLAVNPWHVHMSRWGHEAGLVPLLAIGSFAAMAWAGLPVGRGDGNPPPRLWRSVCAGAIMAIAHYGYQSLRMSLPIFVFAVVVANPRPWRSLLASREGKRAGVAFAVTTGVLIGPLAVMHLIDPEINKRARTIWAWVADESTTTTAMGVVGRYFAHFGPEFLFISGDADQARGPAGLGQFHMYALPLLVAGVASLVARVRTSGTARLVLLWVLVYPAGDLLHSADSAHALRSAPGLFGIVLLAATGASAIGRWVRRRGRRSVYMAIVGAIIIVVAVNVRFAATYSSRYGSSPAAREGFHVALWEASEWLRPRLGDYAAVFCTNRGMNMPYIITLMGLRYDPYRWFEEPREVYGPGEWDLYPRYGKMHFMYDPGFFAPTVRALRENGVSDRVLFIVRPDEATAPGEVIHRILGPAGGVELLLVEASL